jgi:hypothetical protein
VRFICTCSWQCSWTPRRTKAFKQEAAAPFNAAYANHRNKRSTNGEKELVGKIQRALDPGALQGAGRPVLCQAMTAS